VVADQEINFRCDRGFEGALPGVDGSPDFRDLAGVFQLKPIIGPIKILDLGSAGSLITKGDDVS